MPVDKRDGSRARSRNLLNSRYLIFATTGIRKKPYRGGTPDLLHPFIHSSQFFGLR